MQILYRNISDRLKGDRTQGVSLLKEIMYGRMIDTPPFMIDMPLLTQYLHSAEILHFIIKKVLFYLDMCDICVNTHTHTIGSPSLPARKVLNFQKVCKKGNPLFADFLCFLSPQFIDESGTKASIRLFIGKTLSEY